jgi:hypothetical protein
MGSVLAAKRTVDTVPARTAAPVMPATLRITGYARVGPDTHLEDAPDG